MRKEVKKKPSSLEMAQKLRAYFPLAEEPNLVPNNPHGNS